MGSRETRERRGRDNARKKAKQSRETQGGGRKERMGTWKKVL